MFSKLFKLFRNDSGFAIMSFGNTLSSVFGALFYLYFATIVSVETYGQINYVISFAFAAFAISSLGLETTIMTFVPKMGRKIMHECYSIILISSGVASIAVGIILGDVIPALIVVSITSYFMSLVELVTTYRYKEHAIVSIGSKLSQIGLSLGFFFWLGLDGFLLGYSISYFIFGYRFFLGLRNFTLRLVELRGIWRFVVQVYGANTSYTLLSFLDKIVVGYVFGYYILGSYQLAFLVYTFLSIFPLTLFNYILPHETKGLLKKRVKIIGFGMICGMVVLVVFLIPITLPYIFPKYIHVTRSIQLIVFAIIPFTLVAFLRSNILAEGKRTRLMLYAGLISLTLEIIFIVTFGSLFGIDGISAALLLTMTIEFIFLLVANKCHIF